MNWKRLIVSILIVLPILIFIGTVFSLATDVPYMDDFDAVLGFLNHGWPQMASHLCDFHNEHRIAVPRLFFAALYAIEGVFNFRHCILIGDAMLLAYVCLFAHRIHRAASSLCALPFLWLFLDILNYENTLWALTSIQWHGTFLFALGAFIAYEKSERMPWLALALSFAAACNLSGGAGIFIWPALVLMEAFFCFRTHGTWAINSWPTWKKFLSARLFILVVVGLSVSLLYLHGFHGNSRHLVHNLAPVATGFQPLRMIDFFVSFCGAAYPFFHMPALFCGSIVCGLLAMIAFRIHKINDPVLLSMLTFTLGSAVAGALFRSNLFDNAALAVRYRILSLTLIACTISLTYNLFKKPLARKTFHRVLVLVLLATIATNIMSAVITYPRERDRQKSRAEGLAKWPRDTSALPYDTNRLDHADRILRESERTGTWKPIWIQERQIPH